MSEKLSRADLERMWKQGQVVRFLGISIGRMAPCQPNGEVRTSDMDTKDAVCTCRANPSGCMVNGRNVILGPVDQVSDRDLAVA